MPVICRPDLRIFTDMRLGARRDMYPECPRKGAHVDDALERVMECTREEDALCFLREYNELKMVPLVASAGRRKQR